MFSSFLEYRTMDKVQKPSNLEFLFGSFFFLRLYTVFRVYAYLDIDFSVGNFCESDAPLAEKNAVVQPKC
jgi:hypothetical protein